MESRRTEKKSCKGEKGSIKNIKEDDEEFANILANTKQDHGIPEAPVMPCRAFAANSTVSSGKPEARAHQGHIATKGTASEFFFGMVHN